MSVFTWTKDWETGNALIDSEHKELFAAINNLLDACAMGHGGDQIEKTMQFLISYTAKHFGDEENLQQKSGYPDYPNHKKLHEAFKVSVNDMAAELKKTGPTITLVTKISQGTGGWLINHIHREDIKVAKHVNSQAH